MKFLGVDVPKLGYLIACALFCFILCWSIDWSDEKDTIVFLMLILPGLIFPLVIFDYKKLFVKRYMILILLVYVLLSAVLYYGCVWLSLAKLCGQYGFFLAGIGGSLLFGVLTKYLLRVKISFTQIGCAAILSGAFFLPVSIPDSWPFETAICAVLWILLKAGIFFLFTKYLLQTKVSLGKICYVMIFSGLMYLPNCIFKYDFYIIGINVMLWMLLNGVFLLYVGRRSVEDTVPDEHSLPPAPSTDPITDKKTFFSIYLPALEIAMENDHINYGYLVKDESWYMDAGVSGEMDLFAEENLKDDEFVNFVAYYFDAKSHDFPDVGKISIVDARLHILEEMKRVRTEYNL